MTKKMKAHSDKVKELNMVVCIKPVPDPKKWDKLKLDPETMLLSRAEIPAIINALDRHAIEAALTLKAEHGGRVTVISMAPLEAEEQLREAVAMGCDRAVLLSDKAFAGADTLATARCLAAGIQKIGTFDLVLCGAYSLDGSTAQVGPQIAELLDIPDLSHVVNLGLSDGNVVVTSKSDDGVTKYHCDLPVLITLDREANVPRLPGMLGIRRAAAVVVERWDMADLGLGSGEVGLAGSPTQMLNVFTPTLGRKGDMIQGNAEEMARQLLARLRSEQIL